MACCEWIFSFFNLAPSMSDRIGRVGIIGLQYESNTFIASPTTLKNFEAEVLLTGEAVRDHFKLSHHEFAGFFAGLEDAGVEAVPLFATLALPSGPITAETLRTLLDRLLASIPASGLDGLLIAVHGAAVSEDQPDMDGFWLSRVRERVGPRLPIVCTIDPHANLSPAMVAACSATIAYRTNPHLDQRERGLEAARLMARALRGEVHPVQAASYPLVAINIERQLTSASPCRELGMELDRVRATPCVLSASLILGFPYSDVEKMGSSFIVVTDNDEALAQKLSAQLGEYLWNHREDFRGQLIGVDEALDRAARLPGPVCLLDMGDNVGGGGPGDSTFLIHALHRREVRRSCACLFDPISAAQAIHAGVGARLSMRLGGKTDRLHGEPLEAAATVRSLHHGQFKETQVRHGGSVHYNMGACAVIETDSGLTLLLISRRTPPFSLGIMTSCGLEPRDFTAIVAKGVHAPVAAYESVCRSFIRVNAPGLTTADMVTLQYKNIRRGLFPFDAAD
jgi:microcystin degradation protein MlrC